MHVHIPLIYRIKTWTVHLIGGLLVTLMMLAVLIPAYAIQFLLEK